MSGPGGLIDSPLSLSNVVHLTALSSNTTADNKIPVGAGFVIVNNPGGNTRNVYMPHGGAGRSVLVWVPGTGFKLRTDYNNNVKVNNVDSDGVAAAVTIPDETLFEAIYVSATQGWVLSAWTKLGAPITAIVPS